MDELKSLKVDIHKLRLGFDAEYLGYISWGTYLDSWKMVDEGETEAKNLPICQAKKRYYATLPPQRLEMEARMLNLESPNPNVIAEIWVRRHIELYQSIRKFGFKPKMRAKPITVRIARDGSLEVTDGNNTVSILMHLNYKYPIYAEVSSRAQDWSKLKNDLYSFYGKKMLYQPSGHPDFADWEVARECEDRWNIIKPALEGVGASIDIGCNSGWFCRKMVGEGIQVTGCDPDPISLKLARTMSAYHGFSRNNPRYVQDSFENVLVKESFDCALLLSVIHHYFRKSSEAAYSALNLISRRCGKMILEMETSRLPITWNPELVLKHTEYRKFETLSERGRPIYVYIR